MAITFATRFSIDVLYGKLNYSHIFRNALNLYFYQQGTDLHTLEYIIFAGIWKKKQE